MGEVAHYEQVVPCGDGKHAVIVRQEFGASECYLGVCRDWTEGDDPDVNLRLDLDGIEELAAIFSGLTHPRCTRCDAAVVDPPDVNGADVEAGTAKMLCDGCADDDEWERSRQECEDDNG